MTQTLVLMTVQRDDMDSLTPTPSRRPCGLDLWFHGDDTLRPDNPRNAPPHRDAPISVAPLGHEHLAGRDLSGADLRGATLVGTDLSGASLFGATLTDANLQGATLDGADFTGADLTGAMLEGAKGKRTAFSGATLIDARLCEASFAECSFVDARMDHCSAQATRFDGSRMAGASMADADVTGASFQRADLRRIEVLGACFDGADLRGAKLAGISGYRGARWIGADVRDIAPLGTHRWLRFVGDLNYLDEFRRESRLTRVLYVVWWLTSDCGRSLARWSLATAILVVLFGVGYTLAPVDFGSHPTWLSPYYFSVVTMTSLGYGDVLPTAPSAQLLAMVQVVAGYVMLGGLISILSNKMARRSE